jgi:AcrR family transcriptional regulator
LWFDVAMTWGPQAAISESRHASELAPRNELRKTRAPRQTRRVRRAEVGPGLPRQGARLRRWRLTQAMVELAGQSGYQGISIAALSAAAGVSPGAFYEQFKDKEEVLVRAYRACAEAIFGEMRAAVAEREISEVPRLALGALIESVARDPDAARVVFIESMGAGALMLAERLRVFGRFERRAAELLEQAPKQAPTLDVPVTAVLGALRHIVSRHLRNHAEDELPARLDDGLAWLYAYARSPGSAPFSTSPAALFAESSLAPLPPPAAWRPERLPPGSHGLPASRVARSQRTRLIFATAEVMTQRGYANTQVKDIIAAARVTKPTFYRYFKDKEHAFLEAQQFPTQFILDRCVEAYFSLDEWPERLWRCFGVLIELIVSNPAISHLRLVECYSAGPEAVRRAEDITRSFTMFLQEGYRYSAQDRALPRLTSEAIAGAFFEIVQRLVAEGRLAALRAHLPVLTYIALAPFTGPQEAIGLVEELKARELAAKPA